MQAHLPRVDAGEEVEPDEEGQGGGDDYHQPRGAEHQAAAREHGGETPSIGLLEPGELLVAPAVEARGETRAVVLEVLLLEQEPRERRHERARKQVRGEHGDDDAQRERREEEPGRAFEERDLLRAVEDGDGERLSHVTIAMDVLHFHGGVVDEHPDGEG